MPTRDTLLGRPGTDDMNRIRFLRIGIGSAHRLAIDRNVNGTIVVLAGVIPIKLAEMSVPLKQRLLKLGSQFLEIGPRPRLRAEEVHQILP